MAVFDPAGEFLRIAEHYRRLSDEELLILARQPWQLTEAAQHALAGEICRRRLTIPAEETPSPPTTPVSSHFSENEDPYADDRQLVEIFKVWSLSDALQVQWFLDRAGIPFYMGDENATGVDAVTSNFAAGVSVKIMQIGVPWAQQALQEYEHADEPKPNNEVQTQELPVRCPKCDSADVIFERLVPTPGDEEDAARFRWTCDSCGHRWEDDGTGNE